jgi:hypothetical protein
MIAKRWISPNSCTSGERYWPVTISPPRIRWRVWLCLRLALDA